VIRSLQAEEMLRLSDGLEALQRGARDQPESVIRGMDDKVIVIEQVRARGIPFELG